MSMTEDLFSNTEPKQRRIEVAGSDVRYVTPGYDGHMPTAEQVDAVARRLAWAADREEDAGHDAVVNMAEGRVVRVHPKAPDAADEACQTVACHAGHYMLACVLEPAWKADSVPHNERWDHEACRVLDELLVPEGTPSQWPGQPDTVSWMDGSHRMAQDLGFNDAGDLCTWAYAFDKVWGCPDGNRMFSPEGLTAFGIHDTYTCPLRHIADWWGAVAARWREHLNSQ